MGEATAAVLHGVEDLRIETFDLPKVRTDDAVLRVEACGLCGTDHELFMGHIPAPYPIVPGHETVGTIEAIGDLIDMYPLTLDGLKEGIHRLRR